MCAGTLLSFRLSSSSSFFVHSTLAISYVAFFLFSRRMCASDKFTCFIEIRKFLHKRFKTIRNDKPHQRPVDEEKVLIKYYLKNVPLIHLPFNFFASLRLFFSIVLLNPIPSPSDSNDPDPPLSHTQTCQSLSLS